MDSDVYLLEKCEEVTSYISLKVIRHILKEQFFVNSSSSIPVEPLNLSHSPEHIETTIQLALQLVIKT